VGFAASNAVRYNFENMGYETITVETEFAWLNISDADHFLTPSAISSGLTDFEGLFLRTTLARYAEEWGWVNPDYILGITARDRFNNVFNNIDDIAECHSGLRLSSSDSPHPPFVFARMATRPIRRISGMNNACTRQIVPVAMDQTQFLNKRCCSD
jgi:hypothetical protein